MRWSRLRRRQALRRSGPLDCAAAAALLQEYLDSELEPGHAQRVAEHLEVCRRCGLSAETYRSIRSSLERSQQPRTDARQRLRHFADHVVDQLPGSASSDA
jgi:anti-sigma factor RsiW